LEEPPAHAIFLLATTEPHKLPATILSRCQKFDFKRISLDLMTERLTMIAESVGTKLDPEAASLIARTADGAMRDAISVLDQCIQAQGAEPNARISADDVVRITGMFGGEFLARLSDAMIAGNTADVLAMVDEMIMSGKEVSRFVNDMTMYYRDMLLGSVSPGNDWLSASSVAAGDKMKHQAVKLKKNGMIRMIELLSELEAAIKWAGNPRVMTEVALIKMCNVKADATEDISGLVSRIDALEKLLENGVPAKEQPTAAKDPEPVAKIEDIAESEPTFTPDPPASVASVKEPVKIPASEPEAKLVPEPGLVPASEPEAELVPDKVAATAEATTQESPPKWQDVMSDICGKNMSMVTFLKDIRVYAGESGMLTVVFKNERSVFMEMCAKGENFEIIRKAAVRHFEKDCSLRMVLEKDYRKSTARTADASDNLPDRVKELGEKLSIPIKVVE
jgi:DNA polymerase-3 subunit gamma/tau